MICASLDVVVAVVAAHKYSFGPFAFVRGGFFRVAMHSRMEFGRNEVALESIPRPPGKLS